MARRVSKHLLQTLAIRVWHAILCKPTTLDETRLFHSVGMLEFRSRRVLDVLDKFDREDAVPLASALLNEQLKARLLKPLRIQVAKAIANDKAKALLELSDSIADPDTLKDTKTLWKLVKFLASPLNKKGGVRPLPGIRLADGTMAQTHEEIPARWQEHFAGIEL